MMRRILLVDDNVDFVASLALIWINSALSEQVVVDRFLRPLQLAARKIATEYRRLDGVA